MEFSKKHTVSVYDAIYAVLAYDRKCRLVTVDSKFTAQVNQDYIIKLGNNPA